MGMESTCIGDFEHGIEPEYWQQHSDAEPVAQSRGLAFLRQDVGHAAKIREHLAYQARLEGALRLARRVLADGDKAERLGVAEQIEAVLAMGNDAA